MKKLAEGEGRVEVVERGERVEREEREESHIVEAKL